MSLREEIMALPGLRDSGSMSVQQVADILAVEPAKAEAALYALVMDGKLRRWPGIMNCPATFCRPGSFQTMVRARGQAA